MNPVLRPNRFHTAERPDYAVIVRDDAGERVVGRVYFGAGTRGNQWLYAINGWGSAIVDTRDAAMAAVRDLLEGAQ